MDNREQLIRSLAKTMGMSGEKKKEESHFDPSTGTLYCGSRVFQQTEIQKAKKFCMENAKKMASFDDNSSTLYEIAAAAIELLEVKSLASGGKVVISE